MPLPLAAVQIAAGSHHTVILLSSGQVYTCGDYQVGGLALSVLSSSFSLALLAVIALFIIGIIGCYRPLHHWHYWLLSSSSSLALLAVISLFIIGIIGCYLPLHHWHYWLLLSSLSLALLAVIVLSSLTLSAVIIFILICPLSFCYAVSLLTFNAMPVIFLCTVNFFVCKLWWKSVMSIFFCNVIMVSFMVSLLCVYAKRTGWKVRPWPKTVILKIKLIQMIHRHWPYLQLSSSSLALPAVIVFIIGLTCSYHLHHWPYLQLSSSSLALPAVIIFIIGLICSYRLLRHWPYQQLLSSLSLALSAFIVLIICLISSYRLHYQWPYQHLWS